MEENEHAVVDDYKQCVQELLSLLQLVLDEWKEYRELMDSKSRHDSYQVATQQHLGRGRPKFDVSKCSWASRQLLGGAG